MISAKVININFKHCSIKMSLNHLHTHFIHFLILIHIKAPFSCLSLFILSLIIFFDGVSRPAPQVTRSLRSLTPWTPKRSHWRNMGPWRRSWAWTAGQKFQLSTQWIKTQSFSKTQKNCQILQILQKPIAYAWVLSHNMRLPFRDEPCPLWSWSRKLLNSLLSLLLNLLCLQAHKPN